MKAIQNPAFLIITISLIGALAILITSTLLAGQESAQDATYIIIAIWWIPFSILLARSARQQPTDE